MSDKEICQPQHGPHHLHEQIHEQIHQQIHEQICPQQHAGREHGHEHYPRESSFNVLTIRSYSGLSGDILLTGLAVLKMEQLDYEPQSPQAHEWLSDLLGGVLPELKDSVKIIWRLVNGIGGWSAEVDLPHAHEHRNLEEILQIINKSAISETARLNTRKCFEILAECEASVHGKKIEDIHFHEVGALDSILDICVVCELFSQIAPRRFICGPLPVADGTINCAHGYLPAPAPAVLRLMKGIPHRPFEGHMNVGELVTPTALALLRALDCAFGPWPAFSPQNTAIVYGQRVFADAPNGVIFAIGEALL